MNLTPALLGLALYILIWQKLPDWGTLFNTLLSKMPRAIQKLYEDWHCPYCVGFWLGLCLHALTGIWTLPALVDLSGQWGVLGLTTAWFLDALATGTLILVGKLVVDAISFAAIKGVLLRTEFMNSKKADMKNDAKS